MYLKRRGFLKCLYRIIDIFMYLKKKKKLRPKSLIKKLVAKEAVMKYLNIEYLNIVLENGTFIFL